MTVSPHHPYVAFEVRLVLHTIFSVKINAAEARFGQRMSHSSWLNA